MKVLFLALLLFSFASAHSQSVPPKVVTFASFPGGTQELFRFISDNLQYPEDAVQAKIAGIVYVEFTLNENGTIKQETVRTKSTLSETCDNEAVRIVKAFPAWNPAKGESGEDLEQVVTLPIEFILP
jgi:periplasmic protein TonB